jgi:hypothetical protein
LRQRPACAGKYRISTITRLWEGIAMPPALSCLRPFM